MNKISRGTTALAAALLVLASAEAQQQARQPAQQAARGPAGIVEVYACNFRDGQGMEDVLAAAGSFNDWADRNGVNDYTALLLTPYAFSDQLTFDVGWLGAWPSGTAMGMGETKWVSTGAQVQDAFDAAAECSSHTLYAGIVLREPPGEAPEDSVVLFTNCSLLNDHTVAEAIDAQRQWTEDMAGRGEMGFDGILLPLAGETPDAGFAYKAVHGFASLEQLGKALDLYTTGGARRRDELLGRTADCDSPRLYLSHRVRQGQPPAE